MICSQNSRRPNNISRIKRRIIKELSESCIAPRVTLMKFSAETPLISLDNDSAVLSGRGARARDYKYPSVRRKSKKSLIRTLTEEGKGQRGKEEGKRSVLVTT